MQIRLMLLWSACLALVLSIGSCSDSKDFKPINKTGALDSGAPDVILFVLQDAGQNSDSEEWSAIVPAGVSFSAAYARFPDPAASLADLYRLGQGADASSPAVDPAGSPLFKAFVDGGYATRTLATADLSDYLAEQFSGSRFALVQAQSMQECTSSAAVLASHNSTSERRPLTVWTRLPAKDQPEALTEEHLAVPLVFSMPGTLTDGQIHTQVLSLADLGVTLLDVCGLLPEGQRPLDNEGASFARLLQKKPLVWRGFALAKTPAGHGWIRSMRWRLVRHPDGTETITYIEENPTSTQDDSNLSGAGAQRKGLGDRLDAWLGK